MSINLIFLLNLIFVFMVNLSKIEVALFLSILFIIYTYHNTKDKKVFMILCSLLLLLYVNYNLKTIQGLELGSTYKFQVEVEDTFPKLIRVNDKYLKDNYILFLDKTMEKGSYSILGEVKNIGNNKLGLKVLKEEEKENIIKNKLEKRMENILEDYPYKFQDFTKAVILGQKSGLDSHLREKFNYTGTSHILVVSGLHIGIIIFTILFILKKFPYQVRYLLAGVVLTLYCYGIGFTPSVFRAYVMGIMYLGAKIFYEERDMVKALIIAFIVSSFINPYVIRGISYQMSYMALIAILFLFPKIKKLTKKTKIYKGGNQKIFDFLLLSFSIQMMLMPIFLYYFRSLPLFSFIPNLIVIPLGSVLVQVLFIGLILSILGLSNIIMPLGYYLYLILVFLIEVFYKIPFLTLRFYSKISLSLYIVLYAIIVLFILLRKEKIKKFWWITLIIIPLSIINLKQQNKDLELPFGYYKSSPNKVFISNKKLNIRDIYTLKDNKIITLDYLITPHKYESPDFTLAYPKASEIILKKGEKIKFDTEYFINENGKIKKDR